MSNYFSATKPQAPDMTIGALCDFLEKYVELTFPANGGDFRRDYDQRNTPLVKGGGFSDSFGHVACYARPGSNEGNLIDILIMRRDKTFQEVGWMKTFDDDKTNWEIAAAISEAITEIYYHHALPIIVDFAAALPGKPHDMKDKAIYFQHNDTSLDVLMDNKIIAAYDFGDLGEPSAKFNVAKHLKDWECLAKNLRMHSDTVRKPDTETDGARMA